MKKYPSKKWDTKRELLIKLMERRNDLFPEEQGTYTMKRWGMKSKDNLVARYAKKFRKTL